MRLAAFALALLLLGGACDSVARSGKTPDLDVPPTAEEPTSITVPATGSPTPSGLEQAVVVNVVDGDTIDVLLGGEERRVRYIGVDTPETVDPRRPVGCFGAEAGARNRELVDGKTVGMERDVSETDDFGRLLRYVWLGGPSTGSGQAVMVNAQLVEEGYATAAAFPPDVKYAQLFASLQVEARERDRGLWGACVTPEAQAGCPQPLIKGNVSSSGEKIYHVPGGAFYEDTQIDEAKGERWFCMEEDAVAAGWRRSSR